MSDLRTPTLCVGEGILVALVGDGILVWKTRGGEGGSVLFSVLSRDSGGEGGRAIF